MITLREFLLGPLTARYLKDPHTGVVGLLLFPTSEAHRLVERRKLLCGLDVDAFAATLPEPFPADSVLGLAQVASPEDGAPDGFASGRTLLGSPTSRKLRFTGVSARRQKGGTRITAKFRHPAGWTLHHELEHEDGAPWVRSKTRVFNAGKRPLALDLLASGTLTGITPFAADAAPGSLVLHRFRSVWSMEGRLKSLPLEDLQLEPSWSGYGVRCERYGVAGSMPVNGWFPRAILEDTRAKVSWGLEIEHHASWQIEIYRRHDSVGLSGGLADFESGHWRKVLTPGETLESPSAVLACVCGDLDACCDALNGAHVAAAAQAPQREHSLPVIFNDWGTHWGFPSLAKTVDLAARLRGLGIEYLVIDAGWYAKVTGDWEGGHGDWVPSKDLFPDGLKATADAIREAGMIPGLWFEMETCGHRSEIYQWEDMLVHRDDQPVTTGTRRHLDLRQPSVREYLAKRVIGTLRDAGFGYLKIDYNATLGIGADGAESPGEALRNITSASLDFFHQIRRELPELVMENCSSGGHRLVAPFVGATAMSSFSDAHECREIPIIAANLHRLLLPRQSQVWAVLRKGEPDHRTVYSLAAGFLGRLCLSGDVPAPGSRAHGRIREAIALYRTAAPIIRDGNSRRFGPPMLSYRQPRGWQAVRRLSADGSRLLVVMHTFSHPGTREIAVPLPDGKWRIEAVFPGDLKVAPRIRTGSLRLHAGGPFRAQVILLHAA